MEGTSGRATWEGSLSQDGHAVDVMCTEQTNRNHSKKNDDDKITNTCKIVCKTYVKNMNPAGC